MIEREKSRMKKRIVVFLLTVVMCTTLCACGTEEETQSNHTKPIAENSTSVTESEEVADKSEITERPEKEEGTEDALVEDPDGTGPEQEVFTVPVDIDTIGGVVVVGRIGYDEEGWHIVPEQPLNITYTYFLDNPSVFPEQTCIRMMDPKDDGVDKALYLGQTVTVHGEFRFVRNDFETLYLSAYTITLGKVVEESYGDSELRAPEGIVDLYDRSEPLPKYMEPLIAEGKYVYNAFMLSEESLQLMGNDFALFFCDFVDAILNYRSEVYCPETTYAEMLGSVIYYDFPIFNACAEPFEFFKHYNRETGQITIEYKYNADEHQQLLDRFMKSADEMLANVTQDMSDEEKAKVIYHAICTRMVYDESALTAIDRKDSYYAYLHYSGVCITFANLYNQLLTQVGIRATVATCDYNGGEGHAWSVVTLDGKDYFCDPTFELAHEDGNGYRYFGMSYADRTENGLGKDGIRAGKYYFASEVLPEMIAGTSLRE